MSNKNYIDADKLNGLMKDVGEIEPKPENIKALKEIPGHSGYYVDEERLEAWSLKRIGYNKRWKKLAIRRGFISVQVNGKCTSISLAKSIFVAHHNISYDDEGLKRYTFKIRDKKVIVKGVCDSMHQAVKRRMSYIDSNRISITQHRIDVLNMVLLAYKGDPSKLFEYAISQKQRFIWSIRKKFPTLQEYRIMMGYELAYKKMMDVIENGGSDIAEFDGWFVKTARGFVKEGLRNIVFDENYEKACNASNGNGSS